MHDGERKKPLIVVVDDAREIVRGLSLRLKNAGYDVEAAFDGEAGLKLATAASPDAMIVDIRMPLMDGLTMLANVNKRCGKGRIPTIVLSANIAEQARSRAHELGASFFLEKPYDAATVLRAVELMLNANEGAAAG